MISLKKLFEDWDFKAAFKVLIIWLLLSLIFIGLTFFYIEIASFLIIKCFLGFVFGEFALSVLYIILLLYLLSKFVK